MIGCFNPPAKTNYTRKISLPLGCYVVVGNEFGDSPIQHRVTPSHGEYYRGRTRWQTSIQLSEKLN